MPCVPETVRPCGFYVRCSRQSPTLRLNRTQTRPPTSLRSEGGIAGASEGVGATEVPRRDVDEHDTSVLLTAERDERLASADALAARGATEAADDLRAEADRLDRPLPRLMCS